MQTILAVLNNNEKLAELYLSTEPRLKTNKITYQFSNEFQLKCQQLYQSLSNETERITSALHKTKDQSSSFDLAIFLTELNDFNNFYSIIKENLSNLIKSIRGFQVLNAKTIDFYKFINDYEIKEEKLNFFDLIYRTMSNSSTLCDLYLKEYESVKSFETSSTSDLTLKRDSVLDKINLNIFYNPSRVLKKLLFEKSQLAVKNNLKKGSIASNSPTFKFNSPRQSELPENTFYLEVKLFISIFKKNFKIYFPCQIDFNIFFLKFLLFIKYFSK